MNRKKLFIVEDDATFAEMLKDYLSMKPHWDISHFESGEACLEQAFEEPFAVVIDYHLDSMQRDQMNGMDTLVKLKKISPDSHCIFLSGQEKYGLALQIVSHGAEKYIVKDEKAFVEITKALDDLLQP